MAKIGIFDSGFGGLTVLKEVISQLPDYDYIYLGDTARAPYGSRSSEEIYQFTEDAVEYLFGNGCELIILACNTVSAEALRRIQQEYLPRRHPNKRVLGVIVPTAEKLFEDNVDCKVGIIATEATVHSGAYIREIGKLAPHIEIVQAAAPGLVPLIEAGIFQGEEIDRCLDLYLGPLVGENIEALIMGCTHYGHIESEISRFLGPTVRIYNQATTVAEKLRDYLSCHPEISSVLTKGKSVEFLCTGDVDKFTTFTAVLLGEEVRANRVEI